MSCPHACTLSIRDSFQYWQHQRFVSEAQEQEPDVVLIGDSLFSHLNVTEVSLLSVNVDHNTQFVHQNLVFAYL